MENNNESGVVMQRYEIERLLGQGKYAKVYYARDIETSQIVAIKVINKEKVLSNRFKDPIMREISVMRMLKHPNIIELYGVMANKTKIYFVMEYAEGGELYTKAITRRVGLNENVIRKYFRQLISAVEFCHSRGVYHRDLKFENLLLDENDNLKVSDFGLSALDNSKRQDGLLHTICGTYPYIAPEVMSTKGYDGAKADIWSCGVVLFGLLAGYLPFEDSSVNEMYRKIGNAKYNYPSSISRNVRHLLEEMLNPNPDKRITIAQIKEHIWYTKRPSPKPVESYGDPGASTSSAVNEEIRPDDIKLPGLNAFDITLSSSLDLSGLFVDSDFKKETRFFSRISASIIIAKLTETAKTLKFKIRRMEKGLFKLEGATKGRKGTLTIDAQIFEVAPEFHLVEMSKADGNTLEYHKLLTEDVRPALKDIVWAWQGEQQQQQQQGEQQSALSMRNKQLQRSCSCFRRRAPVNT
ncbi:CBL-interacting protein kinase 2-like [Amaranthus tricolor]|uniref:CBL-interacting protein kinase 2-like n=1 Tax=Amaranthus tricolor TaxID=29722 RepID=UPI00258F2AC3|nr:CBL-interacting protein kinase 2-like [Amaranthus tricolor]